MTLAGTSSLRAVLRIYHFNRGEGKNPPDCRDDCSVGLGADWDRGIFSSGDQHFDKGKARRVAVDGLRRSAG